MRIDAEPAPRAGMATWEPPAIPCVSVWPLPRNVLTPDRPFLSVLGERVSRNGGLVSERELASLLWHATLLRERRPVGRFGPPWESRNAPSAGGLHELRLLCLPVGAEGPSGLYDPEAHALRSVVADDRAARDLNVAGVAAMTGASAGVTLQIVADPTKVAACYENSESLVLRDAGALIATICLVATALELASVPLGRAGTGIVRAAGISEPFVGVGAVHVGAQLAVAGDDSGL